MGGGPRRHREGGRGRGAARGPPRVHQVRFWDRIDRSAAGLSARPPGEYRSRARSEPVDRSPSQAGRRRFESGRPLVHATTNTWQHRGSPGPSWSPAIFRCGTLGHRSADEARRRSEGLALSMHRAPRAQQKPRRADASRRRGPNDYGSPSTRIRLCCAPPGQTGECMPEAIPTRCLPSTMYVTIPPPVDWPLAFCHRMCPLSASKA